uniref:Uncharacterized protein n=1 Tax=Panagrolaimus davidi TaxID=227884 RepID=A0A914QBS2_9BILA
MRRSDQIADLTSNSTSTSTKPNRKRKAEEVSTIVPIKQLHFKEPFRRQSWPFRDSFINYITKTPSNSKAWTKLIQSCKYFFAKNPILVTENLWWDEEKEWLASLKNDERPVDFSKLSSKVWITNKFNATYVPSENGISLIIPKIYKCDANFSRLLYDVISYEDFSFLSTNVRKIVLHENIVKNSDGSIVPFENLIAVLPKIKIIFFYDKIDSSCITKNTVKELLKIPHFSKIDRFELFGTTEKFDIETFFTYLKKNKHTKFTISFGNSISETYKNRLEEIVDEIIETEEHDYKIPEIEYNGINGEKLTKLCSLSYP